MNKAVPSTWMSGSFTLGVKKQGWMLLISDRDPHPPLFPWDSWQSLSQFK